MNAVRALLQFTTILPLGDPADFEDFARHSYLYPLAGYLIGGVAALVAFLFADPRLAAAFALATALLFSGFHHFDGLLDFGDALMAHGSRDTRIRALTDRQIGTGGIGLGIVVLLLSYAGLLAAPALPFTILIAEVYAKTAMALVTATGKPFREGLHSYLYHHSRPWFPLAALLLCVPLILLPVPPALLLSGFCAMILMVLIIILTGTRLFGGINGDLVGALNEITRLAVICAVAVVG